MFSQSSTGFSSFNRSTGISSFSSCISQSFISSTALALAIGKYCIIFCMYCVYTFSSAISLLISATSTLFNHVSCDTAVSKAVDDGFHIIAEASIHTNIAISFNTCSV